MKKIKLFSILVIILSVITLGIFMGKQMFKYLETKSLPPGSKAPDTIPILGTAEASPAQGTTEVLYSSGKAEPAAGTPDPAGAVGAPTSHGQTSPTPGTVPTSQPPAPNDSESAKVLPTGPLVAYANGNGINVREEPNLTCKKVMKVANGTKGTVLEQKDGWTKVKWEFNKKVGWTRDDLLVIGPKDTLAGLPTSIASGPRSSPTAVDPNAQKALAIARTISVAVAKPAPPSETVKGFAGGADLPAEGTICSDPAAKVRSIPSVKGALLGKVPKGVVVKIKSSKRIGKHHWFEIIYHQGKKEGWTREDNLQF